MISTRDLNLLRGNAVVDAQVREQQGADVVRLHYRQGGILAVSGKNPHLGAALDVLAGGRTIVDAELRDEDGRDELYLRFDIKRASRLLATALSSAIRAPFRSARSQPRPPP
jgi:hypothetical protein